MSEKKLAFIIVADQPYVHSDGEDADFTAAASSIFISMTETYIPLLRMMERLESDGVDFKLGLVMTPLVCEMLENPVLQENFVIFLDRRIAFGKKELERNAGNDAVLSQVNRTLETLEETRRVFTEVYGKRLLPVFKSFAAKKYLEIISTAATFAHLPHFADLPESVNAQVETGIHASRVFFGENGDGFYLPQLGWAKGFDKILRSYGINYTVVDARSLLFSQDANLAEGNGIFEPSRTENSLVLFPADPFTSRDFGSSSGYLCNPLYRSQERDLGYELPLEELDDFVGEGNIRLQTGYKYWSNGSGEGDGAFYDKEKALEQVKKDARAFYDERSSRLDAASKIMGETAPMLVCEVSARLFGEYWHEGLDFLEEVIRIAGKEGGFTLTLCRDNLDRQFSLKRVNPYPCSSAGEGYAENLIDGSNNWMVRYVKKATERMVHLAESFPMETGLKARLLNMGTREVLLAQSSDWPMMIQDGSAPDRAAQEFKDYITSFSLVFDALASNTVSTEWLTNLEKKHAIFPWINYRVFSIKK